MTTCYKLGDRRIPFEKVQAKVLAIYGWEVPGISEVRQFVEELVGEHPKNRANFCRNYEKVFMRTLRVQIAAAIAMIEWDEKNPRRRDGGFGSYRSTRIAKKDVHDFLNETRAELQAGRL